MAELKLESLVVVLQHSLSVAAVAMVLVVQAEFALFQFPFFSVHPLVADHLLTTDYFLFSKCEVVVFAEVAALGAVAGHGPPV